MTDRNDMIAPSRLGGRRRADESLADPTLAAANLTDDLQPILARESGVDHRYGEHGGFEPGLTKADDDQCQSVASVVADVDEFARGWIGRIRRLIHRSSQLIERESLLAGAIARLDQQKAEWTKRTAAKEERLRDQSKRLTEAWLEVESQRRKAIQGARVAATAGKKSHSGPVIAAPAGPVAGAQPVQQPAVAAGNPPAVAAGNPTAVAAGNPPAVAAGNPPAVAAGNPTAEPPANPVTSPVQGTSQVPVAPPPVNVNVPIGGNNAPISNAPIQTAPIQNGAVQNAAVTAMPQAMPQAMPLANAPVAVGRLPTATKASHGADALEPTEAATRQKIEEFKRMQRAIRSHRNK